MLPARRATRGGSLLHVAGPAPAAVRSGVPAVTNARLAIAILLAFETMFFAALVGAYLVFRLRTAIWPPADLPSLPIAVTWANTLVLLASAVTMGIARRALVHNRRLESERMLAATAALGTLFLAIQGSEWIRLVRHGLTLASGVYGATFYTLIGCHGLHVLAAVVWLVVVVLRAPRHPFTGALRVPVELCSMYWFFVVGLWVALFPLVYLL